MTRPDVTRPAVPCTRRAVLRGAGAVGAAAGPLVLAGCSSDEPAAPAQPAPPAPEGGSDAAPATSVPAAEVPVGGAVVLQVLGDQVVLAQPVEGEFAAYSAVCPHQGGIVGAGEGTVVVCPLHGSQFDTADGAAVLQGPATEPLSEIPLAVEGDQLVIG